MTDGGMRRALGGLILFFSACGGEPIAATDAPSAPTLSAEAIAITPAIIEAVSFSTAASAPLGADGDLERRDLTPTDGEAQDRAANGFSGGSVVTPPTCTAYTWSGLTASIVMTGCTLESTGVPIAGTISLSIERAPTAFVLAFTALSVDDSTYDGSVTVNMGGTDLGRETTVDVSFAYDTPETDGSIAATGLSVTGEATTGVTVDGSFAVTTGGSTISVVATDVTWAPMECHPSSGTALVSGGAFALPTTIGFLPTTPDDGIVTVQIGTFPAIPQMLLAPCP